MNKRVRAVAWVKDEPVGVEFAEITLAPDRLSAVGVAIGSLPVPYRLDYRIETRVGFVTSRLQCSCRGAGWSRSLDLRRSKAGIWSMAVERSGTSSLPLPGGSVDSLDGAMDSDLGLSPVTNTLPVLRNAIAASGGSFDVLAAWISVPDLRVLPDRQRYTLIQSDHEPFVIRYEAIDGSFGADITFDGDGIVIDYPQIARRLRDQAPQASP